MRTARSLPFWISTILVSLPMIAPCQTGSFDFKRYLLGSPTSLSLWQESLDSTTGTVQINGYDSQRPTTPFAWYWGDGSFTSGFFPQTHTYADRNSNYVVKVVSTYSGGGMDSAEIVVWFVPPHIAPIALSPVIAVRLPAAPMSLGTRLYPPPTNLVAFDSSFFLVLPRATLEYVLSVAGTLQRDFANDTMYLFNSKFEQYMLRDSSFAGAYSLWFTDPVSFGVGDAFITRGIDYSSLFHEMGHNFTLNSPAGYYYGGRIDGEANAIFSESMAQIFQHATGYEIVNQHQSFGMGNDLTTAIKQQAIRTISLLRSFCDTYMNAGAPYASWNDPSTPEDETFGTFMAIAYKFCVHAENAGNGYRVPLNRMMRLLQGFCPDWAQRYDQLHNTAAADTFRATLMVSALSYAFATDLRSEFRLLNFPVSDQVYEELYNSATSVGYDGTAVPSEPSLLTCYPNPFNPCTTIRYGLPWRSNVTLIVFNTLGQQVSRLVNRQDEPGLHEVMFDGSELPSGTYFYQIKAGGFVETKKSILLR